MFYLNLGNPTVQGAPRHSGDELGSDVAACVLKVSFGCAVERCADGALWPGSAQRFRCVVGSVEAQLFACLASIDQIEREVMRGCGLSRFKTEQL